jgi:hypothetical protein
MSETSANMSKRQQDFTPRCPLCRLPFKKGFVDEKNTHTVTITQKQMTDWMNKYGGLGRKNVDPTTGKYIAPVLESGQAYATHPDTSWSVQNYCYLDGPHECRKHGLVNPWCMDALTEKGCQCASKSYSERQTLLSVMENGRRTKEAASPAPKDAWFFGWCYLVDGDWKYFDEPVEWPALRAKVIHVPSSTADDTSPWKGEIQSYDDTNGWIIRGRNPRR